jgi:4-hydroxy-tetrahydrodipicolinate synthase
MPANVLPFTRDLDIDESAYRRHLRWLVEVPGVTGVVANGHAAEVSSLTRDERKRSLAIALDEIAGAVPVIAGVYADGTHEAIDLARDARDAGAAGLLIFPPTVFMWGAQLKPDMVVRHFSVLADATDLPLIVFEYPPASGIGYSPDTLALLCKIPSVAGVKDWSNDIVAYERNLGALRTADRPIACCRRSRCRSWRRSSSARTAVFPAWGVSPPTCRRRCSRRWPREISTEPGRSTIACRRSSPSSTRPRSSTCTIA